MFESQLIGKYVRYLCDGDICFRINLLYNILHLCNLKSVYNTGNQSAEQCAQQQVRSCKRRSYVFCTRTGKAGYLTATGTRTVKYRPVKPAYPLVLINPLYPDLLLMIFHAPSTRTRILLRL
jgi:hypothetical protein